MATFLSLRLVLFLVAGSIAIGFAPTKAQAQSSAVPIIVSDNTIQVAPQVIRLGDLLDRLSIKGKQELTVPSQNKVSGVHLFVSFRNDSREQVKSALQSFFSHKEARSYWQKSPNTDTFHLSSRYGENALNKEYWSSQLIALFDHAVDSDNSDPLQQKELTQPILASAKLMNSLFSRPQIERILRGEEKTVTVDIDALEGSKEEQASALYDQSRITYQKDATEASQKKLTFITEEDSNGLTRSVSVFVKISEGVSTGVSYFGTEMESLARSQIKDLWQTNGDQPLGNEASSTPQASTGTSPGSTEHETMYDAFADLSKRFAVSFVAILPQSTGKIKIDPGSLQKSLQLIELQSESLIIKRRGDIVLVCPISFIGNDGVSTALPLTVAHALTQVEHSEKSGIEALLQYARIADTLSDKQIETNKAEFPVLSVVKNWQPFLRLLNKNSGLDLQQEIITDESTAIALNRILQQSDPSATAVAPHQFVSMEETVLSLILENVLPKSFPKDYLVRHSLSLRIKDSSGATLNHTEADYVTVAPQYKDKVFPASP